MVRALRREPGFDELQFRAHQICFVQKFSEREANRTLSINQSINQSINSEMPSGIHHPA
jgi:hypothetical protein